ncbi:hypothetical protein C8Q80DRAFT_1208502 [Daedaleopsis nitida]|nr:hypothetical protein C8Q80DRAFT_1208502 [Daedaleopsis nitida]
MGNGGSLRQTLGGGRFFRGKPHNHLRVFSRDDPFADRGFWEIFRRPRSRSCTRCVAVQPSIQYHHEKLPFGMQHTVSWTSSISVENSRIRSQCVIPSIEDSCDGDVLVWFHGWYVLVPSGVSQLIATVNPLSAWVIGDIDQDDDFLRSISAECRAQDLRRERRLRASILTGSPWVRFARAHNVHDSAHRVGLRQSTRSLRA